MGTYSFGRQHPDVQHTVGLFINSLPIRSQIRADETFVDFVIRMQQLFVDAYRHGEYPFEHMLADAQIPIEPDQNPLFDTMFTMNNFEMRSVEAAGLTVSAYPYEWDFSEYDIYVTAQRIDDGFEVHFNYRTALFKKETMQQIAAQYVNGFEMLSELTELKLRGRTATSIKGGMMMSKKKFRFGIVKGEDVPEEVNEVGEELENLPETISEQVLEGIREALTDDGTNDGERDDSGK